MINRVVPMKERTDIDTANIVERELNGCRVQLFFSLRRNETIEHIVLSNLLLVFDQKMSSV